MKPLEQSDILHVQAAQGWVELGNHREATEELEKIAPELRAHPDVLQARWRIFAKAERWDACLDIATTLTTMTPERRFGWIHRAHSLHQLGRTQEAKDLLLSIVSDFESNSTVPYHLARYCCGLGQVQEAKQWLGEALLVATDLAEVDRVRNLAMEDPALAPLREEP